MKKIIIVSVGKTKESSYQELNLRYKKILSSDINLEFIKLPAKSFSDKNLNVVKKLESERVLQFLNKNKDKEVFLLSENGQELDSLEFSKKIFSINKPIIFIIGGSLGLDFSLLKNYSRISLSRLTFLHEMTKVILLEQLYRANCINKGKSYHY